MADIFNQCSGYMKFAQNCVKFMKIKTNWVDLLFYIKHRHGQCWQAVSAPEDNISTNIFCDMTKDLA